MDPIKIIATDTARTQDVGVIRGASATLSIGGDSTFSVSCPESYAPSGVGCGSIIYADGTELGGIVDAPGSDTTQATHRATWSGRTWSGVLNSFIVRPDAGKTHYTDQGEANEVIARLISRLGIGELFAASNTKSGINLSLQVRYSGAWDALTSALYKAVSEQAPYGGRLSVTWQGERVVLGAVRAVNWGEREREAARTPMRLVHMERPVNHLVCLGQGELLDRTVIDLYADAHGNISQTQTFFGLDERAEVYDYGNSEDAQLLEAGRELLESYQNASECDITGDTDASVGDVIAGRDSRLGVYVSARVDRKSYIIERGRASVVVESGNPSYS